ncbi:hypothetical protein SLS59_007539 [Nothophoma quercina]|uniref:EamA domain-containing protein n=1 Tax=Nothophoma quercina TaxID=749835 RepID=A0ABR3R0I6_9PLEO
MEGNDGKGYHPFHILFARMGITVLCASVYMWYKKTEYFPLGMREVRPLLVARGLFGFFGVFDSLLYLPLADAIVITFLAPSLACWACSYLINEPFTRMEQVAAYVSLFGVVLIARPMSLFAFLSHLNEAIQPPNGDADVVGPVNATADAHRLAAELDEVTPAQRASAVGVALLGICGFVMMLFALSFDKLIWGTTPGALSIIGSSLILGSAIYVAMNKEDPKKAVTVREYGDQEEGRELMATEPDADLDGDVQGIRLTSVR